MSLQTVLSDLVTDEIILWRALDVKARQARIERYWGADRPRANWCAAYASWLREQAGLPVPAAGRTRRGARALVRWVAHEGSWVVAPGSVVRHDDLATLLQPGDVVTWKRGKLSWTQHVATVTKVEVVPYGPLIWIAEGNHQGRINRQALPTRAFVIRLKGLYGVARCP